MHSVAPEILRHRLSDEDAAARGRTVGRFHLLCCNGAGIRGNLQVRLAEPLGSLFQLEGLCLVKVSTDVHVEAAVSEPDVSVGASRGLATS